MTPTIRDWVLLGCLVVLLVVGVFALVRYLRDQRARAENAAAARRTEAEVRGVRTGVLDTERKRSSAEALAKLRENTRRRQ